MIYKPKLFCWLAALSLIVSAGCSSVGSLARSNEKIRGSILERTPIGCSRETVNAFIAKQRWHVLDGNPNEGFAHIFPGARQAWPAGVRSVVGCELGTTLFVTFPFATDKFAYWGFDRGGRLVDVWVREESDAP